MTQLQNSRSSSLVATALVVVELIIILVFCHTLSDLIYFLGRGFGAARIHFLQGMMDAQDEMLQYQEWSDEAKP